MSVKHVKDYYLKVTNDYHEMTKTLEELEKCMTESQAIQATKNIEMIRQQVSQLKENYLRLSYIMFLLNLPNKKEKQRKYVKQERKRIETIPKEHRMMGVLKENKDILGFLNNIKN